MRPARLWSLLPAARVVDGMRARTMRFDCATREVTLARPMAVYRNEYEPDANVAVYALGIETDGSFRPAATSDSVDRRALDVYVQPVP